MEFYEDKGGTAMFLPYNDELREIIDYFMGVKHDFRTKD